jgi:hypothetical protein
MHSFEVAAVTPGRFVAKVRDGLAERGYDRHVGVRLAGDRLTVEFRWMGTSCFVYSVTETDRGFRADLVDQSVAPLHTPFADRFEGYFNQALEELGARTV